MKTNFILLTLFLLPTLSRASEYIDYNEQLLSASNTGDLKYVEEALAKGCNKEYSDINGYTALHFAAINGHEAVVLFLLKNFVNLESVDHKLKTPLHLAIEANKINVVKLLLKSGANIHAKDNLRRTMLHLAAARGNNTDIVELLLSNGSKIEEEDFFKATPLAMAVYGRSKPAIEILLKAGANPNILVRRQVGGIIYTPLQDVLHNGFLKLTNVNTRGMSQENIMAEIANVRQIINLLLNYRADLHINGTTLDCSKEIVAMLGLNQNSSLIVHTLLNDHAGVNKILKENCSNNLINNRDVFGNTALVWAAIRGNLEITKYLVQCGNLNTPLTVKALCFAKQRNHNEISKNIYRYLEKNRQNFASLLVHYKDNNGNSLPLPLRLYISKFIYGDLI